MRTQSACGAARLASLLLGLAVLGAVPATLGAASTPADASRLRDQAASLVSERQSALLHLYGLESELQTARSATASLDAQRARLAREQASTRRQLALAERAARASQRQLEELLRALYERRGADPLAIVLGASSLDEALTGLESLDRATSAHRRILAEARSTRARLARVEARLTRRAAELDRLAVAARARARELESSRAARAAYVAKLHRREDLTARDVTALESQARAAQRQVADVQPVATTASPVAVEIAASSPVARSTGARTLTVSAIAYSLRGRTATGLPAGPGIVAVDPNVIPLGTRLYVPGYGKAVAADTGGAIRGHVIDLWFPTRAAALAWGRRTVVITLR